MLRKNSNYNLALENLVTGINKNSSNNFNLNYFSLSGRTGEFKPKSRKGRKIKFKFDNGETSDSSRGSFFGSTNGGTQKSTNGGQLLGGFRPAGVENSKFNSKSGGILEHPKPRNSESVGKRFMKSGTSEFNENLDERDSLITPIKIKNFPQTNCNNKNSIARRIGDTQSSTDFAVNLFEGLRPKSDISHLKSDENFSERRTRVGSQKIFDDANLSQASDANSKNGTTNLRSKIIDTTRKNNMIKLTSNPTLDDISNKDKFHMNFKAGEHSSLIHSFLTKPSGNYNNQLSNPAVVAKYDNFISIMKKNQADRSNLTKVIKSEKLIFQNSKTPAQGSGTIDVTQESSTDNLKPKIPQGSKLSISDVI